MALLKTVTYKPNMHIEWRVEESGYGTDLIVHLTAYVPDSRRSHPGVEQVMEAEVWGNPLRTLGSSIRYRQPAIDLIRVTLGRSVPLDLMNEDRLLAWLRSLLMEFEAHECDEWLQRDHRPINDPHAVKP